jgi:small subunit ribosomal protein S9
MNQTSNPSLSQGVGRRKSSIAKVQIVPGTGQFLINNQPGIDYLQQNPAAILAIHKPLDVLNLQNKYDTFVQVKGGGISGQATAIQLGIARAICELQQTARPSLKQRGLLTRDARVKERKKYGLKKARKAPQFSKR